MLKDWLEFKYDAEFKNSEPLCYHKVNSIVNSPTNNSKLNIKSIIVQHIKNKYIYSGTI